MSFDIELWLPPEKPEVFEALCLDLCKEIWGSASGAQLNGRSGQAQMGVDLFGRVGHEWRGVQCKQKSGLLHSKLKVSDLEEEVENARGFSPPLSVFIIATSGPRDEKVQRRAREFTDKHEESGSFAVEVWSWEEIWDEIRERSTFLERISHKYWPLRSREFPTDAPWDLRQGEVCSGDDVSKSLLVVRKDREILLFDPVESRHVSLPWALQPMSPSDTEIGLGTIAEWKVIHRLAERMLRALLKVSFALASVSGAHLRVKAYEVGRVVDAWDGEFSSARSEVVSLSHAIKSHGIVLPLLYMHLLPDALRHDLSSTHNGDRYLLPSKSFLDRAMEWLFHALHIADLIIGKYLNHSESARAKRSK